MNPEHSFVNDPVVTAGDLQVLDTRQCLGLMADQVVGRLAWQHEGRLLVFPLTYVVDGDALLFCTSSDSLADALDEGTPLTFEVDDLEPALRVGWSVVAEGEGEVITDRAELTRAIALVAPWRDLGPGLTVFRLVPQRVTGRRIADHPA